MAFSEAVGVVVMVLGLVAVFLSDKIAQLGFMAKLLDRLAAKDESGQLRNVIAKALCFIIVVVGFFITFL